MLKNSKKKRKSLIEAEKAMEAFLSRVGYKPARDRERIHEIPSYKIENRYPLSDDICSHVSKKPENIYSGTELLGIGVAHKSNSMPVSKNSNDAIELAKMRRS